MLFAASVLDSFAQNLSLIDKFCIPQRTDAANAVFSFLGGEKVEFAESRIQFSREGDLLVLKFWPEQNALMEYYYGDKKNLDYMRLYCPYGFFGVDRSNFEDGKIPEKAKFSRFTATKINEDSIRSQGGNPDVGYILYPYQLRYLAFCGIDVWKDILESSPDIDAGNIDSYLVEEKVGEIMKFIAERSDEEVSAVFDIEGVKISVTKKGLMLVRMAVERGGEKFSIENTFVYSKEDPKYEAFSLDDYYDTTFFKGNDLLGFSVSEKGNGFYLNFIFDSGATLYGAYKDIDFANTALKSIDGIEVSKMDLAGINEYLYSNEVRTAKIVFENGKSFQFKKLAPYKFICLGTILSFTDPGIFWE